MAPFSLLLLTLSQTRYLGAIEQISFNKWLISLPESY